MGGAGQHKDKKKAEKQGDVKHRKPFAEQGVSEGENWDNLTPQQKAHEYNLDAAQKEMDRRHEQGEDMTGAKIDKKTYKIVKPKQQGVAEGEYNPDTFVGKKGTYKGYGITQEGPYQWGISSSLRKFTTLAAAKRHIDKNMSEGVAEGWGYGDGYDKGFSDGYDGQRKSNPFPPGSKEHKEYDEGWFVGRLDYNKMNRDSDEQGVAEALDSNFVGFMNKTLGQKADAPTDKSPMPDFMKGAPVAGLDSMGYRAALDFGMKTLRKLTPTQKTKLSIKGEDGVVNWLANQAKKQGLLITDEGDEDTQGKFMQEDLDEVQDFLPEVFHDPAIKSWAFVLTDGEPLPKAPVAGPFEVSINPGIPGQNGYANADWKTVDTLENLPDAKELAQGLAQKNPKQFVGIWVANGKNAGFYWPGEGWRGLAEAGRDGASEKKLDAIRDKHDNYNEEWSQKYKSSINCSHPKGFSQKAHCAGNKKHNESMTIEMTCEDCGMCETHGNLSEIKKGQKDSNGYTSCWSGYHAAGTKKSATTGKQVRNCVPNEGVSEDHEIQMASSELQSIAKNAQALLHMVRKYSEQEGLDAWQQSKITKAADYLNAVLQSVSGEQNPLEGVGIPSYGVGGYRNRGDDERHDLDDPEPQRNRQEVTSYNITINGKPINPKPIFGRSATIAWGKKHAATGADLSNAVISPIREGVAEGDAYMESLAAKLAEKIPKNAPVDVWVQDFQKADPQKYHQFKNKTPEKKAQMAVAASYAAKNPSKK